MLGNSQLEGIRPHFSKLVFLGTGSAVPRPDKRNVSALACVFDNGDTFLLDCGEGTQHQIMRTKSVKMGRISTILITHLHGDHCFGLFGLLCSLGMSRGNEDADSVLIIGPKNIKDMTESVLRYSGTELPFLIDFIELDALQGSQIDIGTVNGCHIMAFPLEHRVPAFGYCLQEAEWRGAFNPKKAKLLGVLDKSLYGQLTRGYSIQLESGGLVQSEQVMGPSSPGKKIAILQDTSNSDNAISSLKKCEILIHEATYTKELEEKAIEYGHSTSAMAGMFAKKVEAKHLILTHFSSRYDDANQLVEEAQENCKETSVLGAKDFLEITIGRNGSLSVNDEKCPL